MYTIEMKVTDKSGYLNCVITVPDVAAGELVLPNYATPAPSLCVDALARALKQ